MTHLPSTIGYLPNKVAIDAEGGQAVYTLIEGVLGEVRGHPSCAEDMRLALRSSRADGLADSPFISLPFLCCQAVGGEERRATAVAAAWYLLVHAARILDDLQDRDTQGSLAAALGPARAINVASALMLATPLALIRLRQWEVEETLILDLLQDFHCTALRVCAGQHCDLAQAEVRLQDYGEIIAAKTGEPFALACRAGATVGGGDARQVALLSEFGHHLGMLNQIGDDLAGVWDSSGKSDLAAGRKTLPVLYALSEAPPTLRERLQELLRASGNAGAERQAQQMITDLGALHYLLVEAELHQRRARAALEAVGSPSPASLQLFDLLEHVSLRKERRGAFQIVPADDAL